MQPMHMTGLEFRAARKAMRLTQERLARRMDITVRHVITLEQSRLVPVKYEYALRWIETLIERETA